MMKLLKKARLLCPQYEYFSSILLLSINGHPLRIQCVIINKSDDKKTVRSRVEDSAVYF